MQFFVFSSKSICIHKRAIVASFSCVSYHENSTRKYGVHYDLFKLYDSIVKSCLNCHDPHLHFDTLRGIKYLIFPATIDFLPQELADFRCHNCGATAFYRNNFTPKHFIRVPSLKLLKSFQHKKLTTTSFSLIL